VLRHRHHRHSLVCSLGSLSSGRATPCLRPNIVGMGPRLGLPTMSRRTRWCLLRAVLRPSLGMFLCLEERSTASMEAQLMIYPQLHSNCPFLVHHLFRSPQACQKRLEWTCSFGHRLVTVLVNVLVKVLTRHNCHRSYWMPHCVQHLFLSLSSLMDLNRLQSPAQDLKEGPENCTQKVLEYIPGVRTDCPKN
jgi:hypothetical protein